MKKWFHTAHIFIKYMKTYLSVQTLYVISNYFLNSFVSLPIHYTDWLGNLYFYCLYQCLKCVLWLHITRLTCHVIPLASVDFRLNSFDGEYSNKSKASSITKDTFTTISITMAFPKSKLQIWVSYGNINMSNVQGLQQIKYVLLV